MVTEFCLFFFLGGLAQATDLSNGDNIRNCPTTQLSNSSKPLMKMDVVPGLGFDALQSLDAGEVYNYNYSSCKISSNGLYLLPDNVRLIPILNSQVDFTAEVYDHADDYSSQVSQSLNVQAKTSYADINAKFSMDYQKVKSRMVSEKSHATRVGLKYHLYSVEINPDTQLNPMFKARILDIAANIQNENKKIAHYLAELLVRDYGTHVVTGIDAGARLSQTTFFHTISNAYDEKTRLAVSASASANFFDLYKIKISYSMSSTTQNTDSTQTTNTSSYTTTHGGPMYLLGGDFTYADWEKEVPNYLVAIDRRGEPISSVLSSVTVPELPSTTLMKVSEYIHKAISRYYAINSHSGCTDYNSPNFNFHANVDDGSCEAEKESYFFGGIFQKCTNHKDSESPVDVCGKFKASLKNLMTSDYSCSDDYQPVLLYSGTLKDTSAKHKKCYRHHWYSKKHCVYEGRVNTASYDVYWCAPSGAKKPTTGLYFGGFYTSTQTNILTKLMKCPQFFFQLQFGEHVKICVASDIQAKPNSLDFGGFFSCSAGNPMAASAHNSSTVYPKSCPPDYSRMMVTVDEDCTVYICTNVKQALEYKPQPPILPPFRHNFHLFSNDVLVLTDSNGGTWVKEANGEWRALGETVSTSDNSSTISLKDDEFTGVILGTIVGTISIVVFLWIAIGCGVKKYQRRKSRRQLSVRDDDGDEQLTP